MQITVALFLKAEGKPAIFIDKYEVTPQPHQGIEGGYEVEIMWVYNDIVSNWIDLLLREIDEKLSEGVFGKKFPFLATFMENFPSIIDLTPEQANMAANLASWNIFENQEVIENFIKNDE